MKRPIFLCLIFSVCAILLSIWANSIFLTGLICAGFILVCAHIPFSGPVKTYYIILMALSLFFGMFSYNFNLSLKNKSAGLSEAGEVSLTGTVTGHSLTYTGRQRLTVIVRSATGENGSFYGKFKIQAVLDEGQWADIGDNVRLKGQLLELEGQRNPGAYNEKQYLSAKKYSYKMYATLVESKYEVNIYSIAGKIRQAVSSVYDASLPQREAALVKSMLIGDRTGLDDYIQQLYRSAGIYHIISISGLHISIAALLIERFFSLFLSSNKAAALSMVFLVFYVFLTGGEVATVRSAIMASVLISGRFIYRDSDFLASACFAGIILLAYEPLNLFDIGFQYSFLAVLGMGILAPPMESGLCSALAKVFKKETPSYISRFFSAISSSAAVFLATLPVQIYHFNTMAPYSIFVNLIIIPLFPIILILGILTGIIGVFSGFLGSIFTGGLYFVLKIYEIICLAAEKLPGASILVATPHFGFCAGFLALLTVLTYIWRAKLAALYKLRLSVTLALVFLGIYMIFAVNSNTPSITMLDVGQGDCVVIENHGEVYIVDGGGWYGRDLGDNTGASVLAPYLSHKGINEVDGAFISHLDSDHATGVIELLSLKQVKRLYLPSTVDRAEEMFAIIETACLENGTELIFLGAGDKIVSPRGTVFSIISPEENGYYKDSNDSGLVMILDMGIRALFAGDIGASTEIGLSKTAGINSDILKLSHHGSKNSNTVEFLDAINPQIAIAGVGERNTYGHPAPETVDRLSEMDIKFYSTNRSGAVIISVRDGAAQVKTMLE